LAPLIPGRCRYLPSCSHYGLEALQVHGPVHGSWLTLRRLLRCHPWGGHGFDPVPARQGGATVATTEISTNIPLAEQRSSFEIDKATRHV